VLQTVPELKHKSSRIKVKVALQLHKSIWTVG